jgi:aryl-alcohol dehydrogenase-like predicted oxidoreductase
MFGALVEGIKSGGINMLDTCTLYRFGKSEKVINAVLNYLIKEEGYKREEFMISTKCGYIPNDIDSNLTEQDFIRILTEDNIVKKEDIIHEIHCVSPDFLDFSVEKSRLGLGLETIDILYLNNFSEAHM